jgi:hypothetical protein
VECVADGPPSATTVKKAAADRVLDAVAAVEVGVGDSVAAMAAEVVVMPWAATVVEWGEWAEEDLAAAEGLEAVGLVAADLEGAEALVEVHWAA